MSIQETTTQTKQAMEDTIQGFKQHLNQIRTGRANANMLSSVMVESYGVLTPINQTASLSAPEPQLLVVKPYDKSQADNIIQGINRADLGFNPILDGEIIRINIPSLTEEIRKDIVKKMYKELENFKVRIRNNRRTALDQVKKNAEISEDTIKGFEKDVQTWTDEAIKQLDGLAKQKEKELMTI